MSFNPNNPNGQATMANSSPMAIASDQSAIPVTNTAQNTLIGAVTETAPASDTDSSGLNGRLQRIAQNITSFIAKFPSSLGKKTNATSLSVTLSSDEPAVPTSVADGANVTLGAKADADATSDTGTFSVMAFIKRISAALTSIYTSLTTSVSNAAITTQTRAIVAGKAVDVTALSAVTSGNANPFPINKDDGTPLFTQGVLQDFIDSMTIAGRTRAGQSTVTRPANTDAYTAGDGIGGIFTLTGVNRGVGVSGLQDPGGYIMSIQVKAPRTAIPSGKKVLVHLFVTSKTVTDNAPFTDDTSSFIGAFEVTMNSFPVTDASSVYVYGKTNPVDIYRTTSTTFYGVIVAGETITPTANGGDIVLTVYTDVN